MNIPDRKSVIIEQKAIMSLTKHPIQAAKLLYSAPDFILRGPIYLIFIILFVGLIYSFWAKKDILVAAPLVLDKEAISIEAVGAGQVVDVKVQENWYLNAGDKLLIIQEQIRASADSEQESFDNLIEKLQSDRSRLMDEYSHNISQLQMDLEDFKQNRGKILQDVQAEISSIRTKLEIARKERSLIEDEYGSATEEYNRIKSRFDERKVKRSQYEEVRQFKNRKKMAMDDTKAYIDQLNNSLSITGRKYENLSDRHGMEKIKQEIKQMEERRDREIKRIDERIQSLKSKLGKRDLLIEGVTYNENKAEYKITFDGLVTRVFVKKGEIITPGTPLVSIIKKSASLEAQILVQNKDIGKIKRGQKVKLKYFAFPYQEYGIPEGTIYNIAKHPSNIKGHESMYVVKATLDKDTISRVGDKHNQELEMGIEGIAEVKVGDKRLIELVYTPISRFFNQEE